jgi:ABC-type amino acid transport substrate-binding protein
MLNLKKIAFLSSFILITLISSGCAKAPEQPPLPVNRPPHMPAEIPSYCHISHYATFREIPGVTPEEIAAVERLQKQVTSFTYGTTINTEAFFDGEGKMAGFTAMVCDLFTGMFDIPFVATPYAWSDLFTGLRTGEIAFTDMLTLTEERRKTYIMTDTIFERWVRIYRLKGSPPPSEIAASRKVRYAFLEGGTNIDFVSPLLEEDSFEIAIVSNSQDAYDRLKSKEVDAFFSMNITEAFFDNYDDIESVDFFPQVLTPTALATQTPEYEPIISIIQKYMLSGGNRHLTEMYNQGYHEYKKHVLSSRLSG